MLYICLHPILTYTPFTPPTPLAKNPADGATVAVVPARPKEKPDTVEAGVEPVRVKPLANDTLGAVVGAERVEPPKVNPVEVGAGLLKLNKLPPVVAVLAANVGEIATDKLVGHKN